MSGPEVPVRLHELPISARRGRPMIPRRGDRIATIDDAQVVIPREAVVTTVVGTDTGGAGTVVTARNAQGATESFDADDLVPMVRPGHDIARLVRLMSPATRALLFSGLTAMQAAAADPDTYREITTLSGLLTAEGRP